MAATDFGHRKVGNGHDEAKGQSQAESKLPPFYERKHGGIIEIRSLILRRGVEQSRHMLTRPLAPLATDGAAVGNHSLPVYFELQRPCRCSLRSLKRVLQKRTGAGRVAALIKKSSGASIKLFNRLP